MFVFVVYSSEVSAIFVSLFPFSSNLAFPAVCFFAFFMWHFKPTSSLHASFTADTTKYSLLFWTTLSTLNPEDCLTADLIFELELWLFHTLHVPENLTHPHTYKRVPDTFKPSILCWSTWLADWLTKSPNCTIHIFWHATLSHVQMYTYIKLFWAKFKI